MPQPNEYVITVPNIGAGDLRVQVCSWLAQLGETVHEGDRIVELSLPGLTFDINSPADGQLIAIDKSTGDDVLQGDVLGKLLLMNDDNPESTAN